MPDGALPASRLRRARLRQCAALPMLGEGEKLRVVLITTRETRRWVIPKGWIEAREAPHRSAAREAFEEAGLAGAAETEPYGRFEYDKRLPGGARLPTEVLVYRYRVTDMLQDWPERAERERRLFTPEAAAAVVNEPALKLILHRLNAA